MYRFIINERHSDLLCSIANSKKNSMVEIGRETGFGFQHISVVMQQWEKEGLIKKAQVEANRVQVSVEITDKGKAIAHHLIQISKINNGEIDAKILITKEVKNGRRN